MINYNLNIIKTKQSNSNMENFTSIGLFTFLRTYSRKHNEEDPKSTIESWEQTISRVVDSSNNQLNVGFNQVEKDEVYRLLVDLKFSVAGRFLWQLGTNTVNRMGLMSLQNCCYTTINDPVKPFTWAMNFLMLGSGIGVRMLPDDLKNFPLVKRVIVAREDTKDALFIVPDSREGWVALLSKLLKAHFYSGKDFTYSCILLRSKGALIKSFGGTASGPDVLCDGIDKINEVLNARAGMNLRPIDAVDIINIIGMIVVAGNVRRSAILCLGDCSDLEYLRAKRWDLGNIPNTRCYSNNSVVCNDINKILNNEEFWEGYKGNGEPYGLINLELMRKCGRVGDFRYPDPTVEGVNPCVSGDTWTLTSTGPTQIKDLVGKGKIDLIVDGKQHSTTDTGFFQTGVKNLYLLSTKEGYSVKATSNHLVKVADGKPSRRGNVSHIWKQLKDLNNGDKVFLNNHRSSENLWNGEGTLEEGYLMGHLTGDGTFAGVKPKLCCWGDGSINERNYIISAISNLSRRSDFKGWHYDSKHDRYCINISSLKTVSDKFGIYPLDKTVTSQIENSSYQFYIGYIRGLFDTDGTVAQHHTKGSSLRLSQSKIETLEGVQRMLGRLGVTSTIYKNRSKAGFVNMPDGKGGEKEYYRQACNDLHISCESMKVFYEKIGFINEAKQERLRNSIQSYKRKINKTKFFSTVDSISKIGKESVYDCTVPSVSSFDANGLVVHNCSEISLSNFETCCLGELFLPNINTKEELFKCARYSYRFCKHSLSLPCPASKETEQIIKRNQRIGVGVTGYLQATEEQRCWLPECYEMLRAYDVEYSAKHNVPISVKLTTCKPSGCSRCDMLVSTDKGLMRLDELGDINGSEWQDVNDVSVYTDNDTTEKITKFYINGKVATKRIITEDGMELESSLNHRYRVVTKDGEYIWKSVSELLTGDNLVSKIGGHPENIITHLKTTEMVKVTNVQMMIQPTHLTKDIAWFLGLFYGDGSTHNKGIRISFNRKQPALLQWLDRFFQETFNLRCTIDNDHSLCVSSQQFLTWLRLNECLKDHAHELYLPKIIRMSNKENSIAFIDGLWRADGGIHGSGNNWTVCTVSEQFSKQLLCLCRSIGYNVRISCAGPGGLGSRDRWILHVRNLSDESMRYASKKLKSRMWNGFWLDPISSISNSECDTFDIEVENAHHYKLGNTISHNTLSILGNTTPGVHPGYSRYYLRRIRISSENPLVEIAAKHGHPIEYSRKFDGTNDFTTKIVSFPCKFPKGTILAKDCTAIQQLEYATRMQTDWSDNSVSVTVYYRLQELDEIKEWLRVNYNDRVKSVSFLLHNDHGFQQAPLEELTKEQYKNLSSKCTPITDVGGICYTEDELDNFECVNGSCPVR
jgi:ribonucleotide reductase class II